MKICKQIISVFIALLVLLTTVGFTINQHYCGGKLAGTSVYTAAQCGCGDSKMDDDCCQNESEFYQFVEDYMPSVADQKENLDAVTASIKYVVLNELYNAFDSQSSNYLYYKPPLLERDIPVLTQSFLI